MHTILAMYVVHMILLLRHLPLLAHLVASEHSVASPRSVFRLPLVLADKGVHIAAS
jgi:hypothetical protein